MTSGPCQNNSYKFTHFHSKQLIYLLLLVYDLLLHNPFGVPVGVFERRLKSISIGNGAKTIAKLWTRFNGRLSTRFDVDADETDYSKTVDSSIKSLYVYFCPEIPRERHKISRNVLMTPLLDLNQENETIRQTRIENRPKNPEEFRSIVE